MARILTTGFDVAITTAAAISCDNPTTSAPVGTVTRDTSSQRTGAGCAKFDSTAGNAAAAIHVNPTVSASTTYYIRAYMRFANLPTASAKILGISIAARLTSGGKLQAWNETGTPAQIGSDSAATIVTDTYYRIELKFIVSSGSVITDIELRLDGATVASASGLSLTTSKLVVDVGWMNAPGASKVCYADDVAVNTGSGSVNNSWPGDGKVVLLLPTADSAEGAGWTRGNGTAFSGGNGWQSVDNTPPVGIADLGGAGADTGQIRNAASNANSNFDATMTDYTTAGIGAADTINAVTPWTATAAPVVTSAKLGTVGVVSNPAITAINLAAGGTAAAFWSGVAGGTYPTGWKWSPGTVTETPTVTLGTAPVMRVQQVTASTRIAVVCFMGMYVDYTPGVAAAVIPDTAMALTVT